jgi:hypothetical protein
MPGADKFGEGVACLSVIHEGVRDIKVQFNPQQELHALDFIRVHRRLHHAVFSVSASRKISYWPQMNADQRG